MTHTESIRDFVQAKELAIVGVSRSGKKFGNAAYKTLKARGYHVYAVHPSASTIEGEPCYASLAALPSKADGVVVTVHPAEAERVVREAAAAGIRRVWMTKGAESDAAVTFCRENGMSVVTGECIIMYAEPVAFPHSLHRWFHHVSHREQ